MGERDGNNYRGATSNLGKLVGEEWNSRPEQVSTNGGWMEGRHRLRVHRNGPDDRGPSPEEL